MSENIKDLYKRYSLNTYNRQGPVFIKGKGSWLWDEQGKRHLDLFPGWGVAILGHSHAGIVKAICRQASELIHLPNNLYFREQALLAKDIVDLSFPSRVFFANSGAEAVEGAIKISRLFGEGRRFEVITMEKSFHGRTFGALSATGQKKYKDAFKPILPGFREAEFNNLEDFQNKLTSRTVAVLLELIQGEGGVNVAEKLYIKKMYDLCRRKNILFMVDEVQTGMGRTGKLFCYQHYGIKPDVMVLSKGLGAGVPISALVVNRRLADIIKPGMHASTFGGSPLVTSASREALRVVSSENFLKNVREKGEYLFSRISGLKKKFSFIKEARGMALMVAVEFSNDASGLFGICLQKGLIINVTQGSVVRFLPALNITRNELKRGLDIFEDALGEF